jgi:hypothetical protein
MLSNAHSPLELDTQPDTQQERREIMKNAKSSTRARSHADGLTLVQQNAVDLLAAGKNDTETAEFLKVTRVTVTRWRLYSPEFRAALAVRRADIWGAAAARLRALIPKAIDALAEAFDSAPAAERVELAFRLLKLIGPPPPPSVGSFDPEDYIREIVDKERQRMPSELDRLIESGKGLPSYTDHHETVRKRLALLSPADAEPTPTQPDEAAANRPDPSEAPNTQ